MSLPRRADERPSDANASFSACFLLKFRKLLKKAEKPFDFSPIACKLCFGIAFLPDRDPVSSSFHRLFQQKCEKTRQVIFVSFATKYEKTSKDHCVFLSCWAFFCRLGSRFLAGPSRTRTGKRPAFFVFRRQDFELDSAI